MARVRLRFSGVIRRHLADLRQRGADTAEPMKLVALDLLRSTRRNFQAQGRRDGGRRLWPAWAPATVARKEASGRQRSQILQDTGRLMNSVQPASGRTFAEVGTTVDYASDHQQGGNWGGRLRIRRLARIPAHQRTARVRRKGYSVSQAHARRVASQRLADAMTPAERTTRRRKNKRRAAASKFRKKKAKRLSKNLIKRKVLVRAHTQEQNYLLPARPFLWIHREDVARAIRRVRNWVFTKRAAA